MFVYSPGLPATYLYSFHQSSEEKLKAGNPPCYFCVTKTEELG